MATFFGGGSCTLAAQQKKFSTIEQVMERLTNLERTSPVSEEQLSKKPRGVTALLKLRDAEITS